MVFYCSAHALFSYVRLCSLYVYVLCIFICSTFYTFLCPYLILFFISTFLCLFVFFLFSHVSTRDVTEPAEIRLHRISHLTSVQISVFFVDDNENDDENDEIVFEFSSTRLKLKRKLGQATKTR